MDETILFPSPNWFLVSNLAVSKDGWLVYGGPSKSLCVLEPLDSNLKLIVSGTQGYQAHVVNRAHFEKIVSVDISPEWSVKRSFITGSADGFVKQWALEKVGKILKIKSTHTHEIHHQEKEEVVSVGYSNEVYAITVGGYGNLVKWDLNSNVVKTYHNLLKNFKPVCMSCSHHIPLNIAVGTKQGVIFVIDLNGSGKIIYKVRGQDDEVMNISWCPQYNVDVKKTLKETEKHSFLADRLNAIRNEPEPEDDLEAFGIIKKLPKDSLEASATIKKLPEDSLEASGIIKKLPEDSFDESVVVEDDTFDIYKDHESEEFGHKKYEPEEIVVKVKEDSMKDTDYWAECMKLKDDILKRKNQTEPSMESLVDALDKTHVDSDVQSTSGTGSVKEPAETKEDSQSSEHPHKHLLATISKHGGVRIWSKSGKLVGSCAVPGVVKNQKSKVAAWPTLLWYKPDVLLVADAKSQLLECNPLQIDCKNKLEWRIVHTYHKRGLYCIASHAPRVQTDSHASEHWPVWTVSQDRNIISYNMENKKKLATYATCGGFLYTVQTCPYDAGKVAISVGDGAVRVWQSSTQLDDDTRLTAGSVHSYWQNVQGKVLTVAWHPTKENLLAFATAEYRVGLIDTSGKAEKAARVLVSALSGGVYSLCWGGAGELYASGGGELVKYHTETPNEAPERVRVELEGESWRVSAVKWTPRGLLCGNTTGAVAILTPHSPHQTLAVAFLFTKMIHTIEWHPQETSSSSEESKYKNLIAVCSLDKDSRIAILEYGEKEDGTLQLSPWKWLSGHAGPVLQLAWSPHRDAHLLSTSLDSTVRIWEVCDGVCVSIFGGHAQSSLGAAWSARPALAGCVVSGGGDACLRLWNIDDHPAAEYVETKHETVTKRRKRDKKEVKKSESEATEGDDQVAASIDNKIKVAKRFLLPITTKQLNPCNIHGLRKMLQKYITENNSSSNGAQADGDSNEYDTDYVKMFGSINDVNELLDMELERHLGAGNVESWITLSIFRGHIDSMIQFANQRDLLCPYLVSIAPCVSFKYWKDVTQLYVAQIDRLVATGEEGKLYEVKSYGGPVYRKAGALLAVHDVKSAVTALTDAHLYKEAYILCRTRYMDSIAQETLWKWLKYCQTSGLWNIAAMCYIALGEFSQAATILANSNNQESLSLAADLAKVAGQNTFAYHVEKKAQIKQSQAADTTEELLEQLPSRIDLLMKENKTENGEASSEIAPVAGSVSE